MKNFFAKSEQLFDKLIDVTQFITNMFLLFIMLLISFDVIGRNLFNKPIKGAFELTELGAALLVFFALAVTHRQGEHITIDFLVDRFSKKIRNWLVAIIEFCIAIVLLYMSWHMYDFGLRSMARNTTTTDLLIPIYPFLIIAAITLIIFAITAIIKAVKTIGQAVNET